MGKIIPSYLATDYDTVKSEIIEQLKKDPVFQDFNFEGSNISIITELHAYLSELTTYYINKLATNSFIDTSELYETVHRNAQPTGYEPTGWIAPEITLTISIPSSKVVENRVYEIPKFATIETMDGIPYTTVEHITKFLTPTDNKISVKMIQGSPFFIKYKGSDIIDYELILPNKKFAHNFSKDYSTIEVYVNNNYWSWVRGYDFYGNLSPVSNQGDNQFFFKYDKYKRYIVEFSYLRELPYENDIINILTIETLGRQGNTRKNSFDSIDGSRMVYEDIGKNWISQDGFLFVNGQMLTTTELELRGDSGGEITNTVSIGGNRPTEIPTIKFSSKGELHSQLRDLNDIDYKSHLQQHNLIWKANAWNEERNVVKPNLLDFNKTYITVIPSEWNEETILTKEHPTGIGHEIGDDEWGFQKEGILKPVLYKKSFIEDIKKFLEPRKSNSSFEIFEIPDLVYFSFEIDLKIKRLFNFSDVKNTLENKLQYYFFYTNREFGEIIDFIDIENFIKDTSIQPSEDFIDFMSNKGTVINNFNAVSGITNIIFRDVISTHKIYTPKERLSASEEERRKMFPYFLNDDETDLNRMYGIQLAKNQFPDISLPTCIIKSEV